METTETIYQITFKVNTCDIFGDEIEYIKTTDVYDIEELNALVFDYYGENEYEILNNEIVTY